MTCERTYRSLSFWKQYMSDNVNIYLIRLAIKNLCYVTRLMLVPGTIKNQHDYLQYLMSAHAFATKTHFYYLAECLLIKNVNHSSKQGKSINFLCLQIQNLTKNIITVYSVIKQLVEFNYTYKHIKYISLYHIEMYIIMFNIAQFKCF